MGYKTVYSVAYTTRESLLENSGLTAEKVDQLCLATATLLLKYDSLRSNGQLPWIFREAPLHSRPPMYISTGSINLDRILDGGVRVGSVIEIAGEAGAGNYAVDTQSHIISPCEVLLY